MRNSASWLKGLATLVALLCLCSQASAGIRPSFVLENCAWRATHIVVVTEGKKVDGYLQVIESWKGDLEPGTTLNIPELAEFSEPSSRVVKPWPYETDSFPDGYLTGERMILFLIDARQIPQRAAGEQPLSRSSAQNWKPASSFKEMFASVVWLERGEAYAFIQRMNPGPSLLSKLGATEDKMRGETLKIIGTQKSLAEAAAISDPASRAEALKAFVHDPLYQVRASALDELEKCGRQALPVLRNLLSDLSYEDIHYDVVTALAKAGGTQVGEDLTRLVAAELAFWRRVAPGLQDGWWNGAGFDSLDEVEPLRNRYSKAYRALVALKELRYALCESVVIEFRDFWRSLPQLEDKSGLDQMSKACDEVLHALGSDLRGSTLK